MCQTRQQKIPVHFFPMEHLQSWDSWRILELIISRSKKTKKSQQLSPSFDRLGKFPSGSLSLLSWLNFNDIFVCYLFNLDLMYSTLHAATVGLKVVNKVELSWVSRVNIGFPSKTVIPPTPPPKKLDKRQKVLQFLPKWLLQIEMPHILFCVCSYVRCVHPILFWWVKLISGLISLRFLGGFVFPLKLSWRRYGKSSG